MPGPFGNASIPFHYADFHGGLNTRDSVLLLTDNQARDMQNVQGTTAGAIVKRNGLVTLASPADTLTSLQASEATPVNALIGAGGTSLYSIGSGGAVAAIKTGLTSGLRWEFISGPVVSGQGPVYGVNGTDAPQQWSGATAATLTANWTNASGGVAVPNGKYLIYANNQAFISGVSGTPSRVFWSAIADPTNWDPASLTGAGFADFDPNDGQAISAIGRVGPYVLVFKPRKMWLIADPATATIRRVSASIGCVAHRSIASGAEGTYFLSEDRGVYVTNGTKITAISDLIQPTIDAVGGQRSQAAAVYYNGHYYLSVTGSGSGPNDTILDWDESLNSWWKHTIGSNQFAIWHASGSAVGLYSAKPAGFSTTTSAALATTLSAALTTAAAITSLPVNAVGNPIASGVNVVVSSGTNSQTFVTSAAVAAGATAIPVNSLTPNFAYPSGSLTAPATTQIPVNAIPTAMVNGGTVTITSGASLQMFTLTAAAAAGATSLSVGSLVPTAVFASGSTVQYAIVDQCFVPNTLVDNGTAFKWRWAGPWQSPSFYRRRLFPTVYFRKRLRQVRFQGSGSIDYSLATDFTTTETLIRQNLFGAAGGTFAGSGNFGETGSVFGDYPTIRQVRINNLGVHNAFSSVFSATSTTADMMVSFTLMMTDRKDGLT